MNYINKMVDLTKNAKTDNEIKEVLFEVYMDTQYCSDIRNQFDQYHKDQEWINHVVSNLQ